MDRAGFGAGYFFVVMIAAACGGSTVDQVANDAAGGSGATGGADASGGGTPGAADSGAQGGGGASGGTGPIGGASGSGGEPDPGLVPEPGTCRRLCCSSSDCASGQTCTPFNPSWGSLGTCNGLGMGAGGSTVSPSCWTASTLECNPLTSEGCSAGTACDFSGGEPEIGPIVACFGGDNTQSSGQACDAVVGPFCVPGFHCTPD